MEAGSWPLWVEASTVVPLSVEEMTRRSAVVARAKVRSSVSSWGEQKKHIFTKTVLELSEVWVGEVTREIELVTLGGQVGDRVSKVAGGPEFTEGDDVVVFLGWSERQQRYYLLGLSQGYYRVEEDAEDTTFWAKPVMAAPNADRPNTPIRLGNLKGQVQAVQVVQ